MLYIVTLVITLCALTVGCKEESPSKKVEIVDGRTGGDPTTGTQAVSDEDFADLQNKVKQLESKLTALEATAAIKTDVANNTASINTLNSTVANQGSQLALVNSAVNSLATSSLKQLWLYDGNKIKKHKVMSIQDTGTFQEAIVEISAGISARYPLNRQANSSTSQAPSLLKNSNGGNLAIVYELTGCTGQVAVSDGDSGGDVGQAGAVGNLMVWVAPGAASYAPFPSNSLYMNGSCTNSAVSEPRVRVATVSPLSTYTYPNPLTVGP